MQFTIGASVSILEPDADWRVVPKGICGACSKHVVDCGFHHDEQLAKIMERTNGGLSKDELKEAWSFVSMHQHPDKRIAYFGLDPKDQDAFRAAGLHFSEIFKHFQLRRKEISALERRLLQHERGDLDIDQASDIPKYCVHDVELRKALSQAATAAEAFVTEDPDSAMGWRARSLRSTSEHLQDQVLISPYLGLDSQGDSIGHRQEEQLMAVLGAATTAAYCSLRSEKDDDQERHRAMASGAIELMRAFRNWTTNQAGRSQPGYLDNIKFALLSAEPRGAGAPDWLNTIDNLEKLYFNRVTMFYPMTSLYYKPYDERAVELSFIACGVGSAALRSTVAANAHATTTFSNERRAMKAEERMMPTWVSAIIGNDRPALANRMRIFELWERQIERTLCLNLLDESECMRSLAPTGEDSGPGQGWSILQNLVDICRAAMPSEPITTLDDHTLHAMLRLQQAVYSFLSTDSRFEKDELAALMRENIRKLPEQDVYSIQRAWRNPMKVLEQLEMLRRGYAKIEGVLNSCGRWRGDVVGEEPLP